MLDTDVGRRLDVPAAVVVLMDGASRDDPVGAASTLQQYATVVTIGIKVLFVTFPSAKVCLV